MRKLILPVAFIGATTALACSFQVGTNTKTPQQPSAQGGGGAAPVPTPQPTPAQNPARRGVLLGKRTVPAGATPAGTATTPTTPAGTTTPTDPPASELPLGVPVVASPTAFGGPTPDASGWKGNVYFIAAGSQKIPDLNTATPSGLVFINQLDISSRAFAEGFPGIDPAKKENFAIRYEAPLVVENAGDYEFRLVADDGAILRIDGMVIVDNDGARTSSAEKKGPVHLVQGTHVAQVDYFNTTGNVALQLFCKKLTDTSDHICPTRL